VLQAICSKFGYLPRIIIANSASRTRCRQKKRFDPDQASSVVSRYTFQAGGHPEDRGWSSTSPFAEMPTLSLALVSCPWPVIWMYSRKTFEQRIQTSPRHVPAKKIRSCPRNGFLLFLSGLTTQPFSSSALRLTNPRSATQESEIYDPKCKIGCARSEEPSDKVHEFARSELLMFLNVHSVSGAVRYLPIANLCDLLS
jgi:hypothetical protein